MKFKKIVAAIGSVMMLGATIAGAFAANYPAPFAASDTVVVYGNNADLNAATSIANDLGNRLGASGSVSVSGESYKIEASSDKWGIGENATAFRGGVVSKSDLPQLLADGTIRDRENNERKYTQKLQLNESLKITHFSDYDYKKEEPTVGIHLESNSNGEILRYELEFTQQVNATLLQTKEITIMGKKYYIHSASNTKVELLDASNKVIVTEGEQKTVSTDKKTYTVEISSVSGTTSDNAEVRLLVNGELTDPIKKSGTYKLSDNSYVSVLDIVVGNRERDNHKVEVAIGSGKIKLQNNADVELNDKDSIRNLRAYITGNSATELKKISLVWVPYDEAFLTPESSLTMPVFENVKLVMQGINFPKKEEIKIEGNGADKLRMVVPITDGTYNLDLAYANSTHRAVGNYTGLGRDANNKLVVGTNSVKLNESANEKIAVLSWVSGNDAETYIVSARASKDGTVDVATIRNEITGDTCDKVAAGGSCRFGRAEVVVSAVDETAGNRSVILNAGSGVSFNKIYTKEGLTITLPANNDFDKDLGAPEFTLVFQEEDKDGKIANGKTFNVTANIKTLSSENRTSVKDTNVTTQKVDISGEDRSIRYLESELATKVELRTPSSSANSVIITYHGSEVSADVFVAASSAVSGGSTGLPVVTDSETDKMTGKNLVVVGGPCANAVAAELLGGKTCTSDFTAATGIGAGEFLIQSFNRGGKVALLVAGYEKEDTVKAANYLTKIGVDTAVGKKYKGTSETSATLVV
ncbi:MAG: hypothetical protein QXX68_00130 [Candidatus Pacearchaeota archaeon]